ncbi:MAG TPA: hypothetical protein VG838_11380 [Opitutaceae bacterium]|nr:hypothetical protein [Opitutaceae bacterium]
MNEDELQQCHAALGAAPGATIEEVRQLYLGKSQALAQAGAPEEERARLRATYNRLMAHLRTLPEGRASGLAAQAPGAGQVSDLAYSARTPAGGPVYVPPPPPSDSYQPLAFDRPLVNALALPVVGGLAILVTQNALGAFLLQGFHVWVHEFGHATAAWLTGKRALPLPIGWTNLSAEKSLFVYIGLLLLLGLLFAAGWRERKPWPMIFAAALAGLQAYMTWILPAERGRMWIVFGGCGGQFYLSALMIGLFYCELPEKFKWGLCRYVFLFIGASSFYDAYTFWQKVKYGAVPLPYGSMVNGEEDASGDLDTLSADFDWSDRTIIATYTHLGNVCLAGIVIVYAIYALQLNRLPGRLLAKMEVRQET